MMMMAMAMVRRVRELRWPQMDDLHDLQPDERVPSGSFACEQDVKEGVKAR